MDKTASDTGLEALLEFLRRERGFDFTGYKRPSLMRRVLRRMQLLGLQRYEQYQEHLAARPEEFALLFDTVLINVTAFFRDEAAWDYLAKEVVPAILAGKGPEDPVRAWSAGCASGQEAYSLAMVLAEAMGARDFRQRAKVYATDVDEHALAQARHAAYTAKEMESVPAALRERYFQASGARWQFRPDLRRAVIFGRHDLVQDPPISRLDLLACRNVLMYFNAATQKRILAKFHYALNGDGAGHGYLFLGRAEMLLRHGGLFRPVELKHRVFASLPTGHDRPAPHAPVQRPKPGVHVMPEEKLKELALEESPVARIVVDASGILALANQRARLLFSLNPKDVGRPLSELEISYRPAELRSLVEQAFAERRTVTQTSVERRFPNGEVQYLDVVVSPLLDGQKPLGAGIAFLDVTRYTALQEELRHSRAEIQTASEELQSANEELETTNEELQSSNEELETTNEELQSTNEELETMNEELQSTNEELQSLNEELRSRTEELHRTNAFLHSVLGSLRGAAIVVDRDVNVLMWNDRAQDLWGLRPAEAHGKPLLGLDIGLPLAELRSDIRACLHDGVEHRETVLNATNRRGKSMRCAVSCTPLVTADGKREGVILLMNESP